MTIEIRTIGDDELVPFVDALATGFVERPDVARVAEEIRPFWDLRRVLAAVEDGAIRGTFRSWPTELTIPGGQVLPASAITAVTVLPTHRRRGILRRFVETEHAAMRDRGEAAAVLYASEYPIYGRFGYGMAVPVATWTIDTATTGFVGAAGGSVELAPVNGATRDLLKGLYETARTTHAGEIRRRDIVWDYDLGLREDVWDKTWKGFVAVHRDATGQLDGYARYHVEDKWEQRQPRDVLTVDDLQTLTETAYAELWRFVVGMDWIATVRAPSRSPQERLPWLLTNARAAVPSEVGDGLWVRLIDVPRALEARTYEREGCIVLDVVDPEAPGGHVRVELDAGPTGTRCRPTTRSADLELPVAALGAAYLGGHDLGDVVLATGVAEHRAGALAEAAALLHTRRTPWCSSFF